MNMVAAAHVTMELARKYMQGCVSDYPETDYPHLMEMLEKMEAQVSGDGVPFSEGKLGRWLGWMQACVVMNCMTSAVNLETMKEINRRFSDDKSTSFVFDGPVNVREQGTGLISAEELCANIRNVAQNGFVTAQNVAEAFGALNQAVRTGCYLGVDAG